MGEKALQMTYTSNREIGHTIDFVPVEASLRNRFSLSDDDVEQLARHAVAIENHYGRPMDIEWGKDGIDGGLYILQARPETVQSRRTSGSLSRFRLNGSGRVLVEGRAIGQRIGAGSVRILTAIDQMAAFKTGDVLVADMTDPDWEPIMKRASGHCDQPRRTHLPRGDHRPGTGDSRRRRHRRRHRRALRRTRRHRLLRRRRDRRHYEGPPGLQRRGNRDHPAARGPGQGHDERRAPEQAFTFAQLPNHGVGLARLEFIINRQIGIHPKALLNLDEQPDDVIAEIRERIAAYDSPRDYYIKRLAEGVATIAAAFAPEPVIVRMSDFKSNEYANLIGGPPTSRTKRTR